MRMILIILGVGIIGVLAWIFRKAARNTPFERRCACTPHMEHLRWLERGEKREDARREQRW